MEARREDFIPDLCIVYRLAVDMKFFVHVHRFSVDIYLQTFRLNVHKAHVTVESGQGRPSQNQDADSFFREIVTRWTR